MSTLAPVGFAQLEFPQIYPQPGWVEHDPQGIWTTSVATARAAMASAGVEAKDVAAIGITNQRETTIVWDRATGKPIHNAIVWQDRRTHEACAALARAGHEKLVTERTGLLLDPYFSATKIAWLLDNVPHAREAAEAGKLAFGTVDTYLLWHLTGGKVHATDATNAARTLLLDIRTGQWDEELLDLFGIPASLLPEVRDCASDFGTTLPHLLGAPVRILGIAGDQQAATIGQGCFKPGMMKSTYGTGCFALLNTGDTPVKSRARMLTTIAYQLEGKRTYALEGAIFIAGAAVQWLRDGLKLIATAAETGTIAAHADPADQVYMVPAFVGLGAPWWDAGGARRALRALAQVGTGRDQPRRARSGRLPDPRPARRDARRLAGREGDRHRAARRRRHDAERLHHAVPRRHPERAGRPAGVHGDDRARRGLSGGAQGRRLPRPRRLRGDLEARPPLHASDGCGDARPQMARLAGRGAPHVDAALGLTISDRPHHRK